MTSPRSVPQLRIARPTAELGALERFWCDGVGMEVWWRTDLDAAERAAGHHDLVMVGLPGAAWHLELVGDAEIAATTAPSAEDLLVLYLGDALDDAVVRRVIDAGGTRVTPRNPYWDEWGITVEDPDGYRLVLSHRNWG